MHVPPGEVAAVERCPPRGLDEAAALARDVRERRASPHRGAPGATTPSAVATASERWTAPTALDRAVRDAGARSAPAPRASARARATTSRSVTVTVALGRRRAGLDEAVGVQLAADVDVGDLLPARGDVRDDGLRGDGRRRRRRRCRSPAGGRADVPRARSGRRAPCPARREVDASLAREPPSRRGCDRAREPRPRRPRRPRRRRQPAVRLGGAAARRRRRRGRLELCEHARPRPRSRPPPRRSAARRRRAPRSRPSPCRSRPRRRAVPPRPRLAVLHEPAAHLRLLHRDGELRHE